MKFFSHILLATMLTGGTSSADLLWKKQSPAVPFVLHERLQLAESHTARAEMAAVNIVSTFETDRSDVKTIKGHTLYCMRLGRYLGQIEEGVAAGERAGQSFISMESIAEIKGLTFGAQGFCSDRSPLAATDKHFSENVPYGEMDKLSEKVSRLIPLLKDLHSAIEVQYNDLHSKLEKDLVGP